MFPLHIRFLLLLLFVSGLPCYSQLDAAAEINLRGLISTENELPFWLHHNQRGRISKDTDLAGWFSGRTSYFFENGHGIEMGGGVLFNNSSSKEILPDEFYVQYFHNWFQIIAGRKHRPQLYKGLSASNENIIWSLNAKPLPGIQFKTSGPVFPFSDGGLGFEVSWEEYLMEEDRYVANAKIHHKSFHLFLKNKSGFKARIGMQHFVQWGGLSTGSGQQPEQFSDYLKVITGQPGGTGATEGDQANSLGNHLGSYEINVSQKFRNFEIELLYNHLFEDGSGRRLGNTPDGRYAAFVTLADREKWISNIMYEFYYTKHQSHTTSGLHVNDNYFNNGVYRSGWTYKERVIGAPFFIPNSYKDHYSGTYIRIGNNNFVTHHVGISGSSFVFPYKMLLSYSRNYGHKNTRGSDVFPPDDPRGNSKIPSEILSTYLNARILHSLLNLNVSFGMDFSPQEVNFGIGINFQKEF